MPGSVILSNVHKGGVALRKSGPIGRDWSKEYVRAHSILGIILCIDDLSCAITLYALITCLDNSHSKQP